MSEFNETGDPSKAEFGEHVNRRNLFRADQSFQPSSRVVSNLVFGDGKSWSKLHPFADFDEIEKSAAATGVTRFGEAGVRELGELGIKAKPTEVISAIRGVVPELTYKEYRQMVSDRAFFYWGLPQAQDIPELVGAYRGLAATRPEAKDDGVPSLLREAAEAVGKVFLMSHGVSPDLATVVVKGLSYLTFGPKSAGDEVIDLGIDALVGHYPGPK